MAMSLSTISLSTFMLSMLILMYPLIFSKSTKFQLKTKNAIMTTFFVSLTPIFFMINENLQSASFSWKWFNTFSSTLTLSFQLDQFSILFTPIALMISWSIMEFSMWYMSHDKKIQLFFKYLLVFLLTMMLLISSNNLLTLFIGWEGVGIMSYLLIGWFFARSNAGAAALQAVLYNRIGDIGFMFSIMWMMSSNNSLELDFVYLTSTPTPVTLALIIAAASKSAQFGLHPWLASAMEGPTPVSALLHSSTMVVAGVFLLIRINPLMENNQTALSTCLCLGAISTAFASASALMQNDMKKIVALSTSSQLGLMTVAIGLNSPNLAFFHICTHASFKAMLFLCSGLIIHNLKDEQDIRKMGGLQKTMPVTTSCMSLGSLALMGTPYVSGFFSKDAIIEAMNTSYTNTWALTLTIIATSLTAVYSMRIMFFASMQTPRTMNTNTNENSSSTPPIKRLAITTVVSGYLINQLILPTHSLTLTLPTQLKTSAIMISILGFAFALDLAMNSWSNPPLHLGPNKLMNPSFYHITLHRLLPTHFLNLSLLVSLHLINSAWLEKIGPTGMAKLQLPIIKKNQEALKGHIKTYISMLTVTPLICLLILKHA